MKHPLLLGFLLSPVLTMAAVIVNCPTPSGFGYQCDVAIDTETAVGNTGTIDIGTEFFSTVPGTATFTLSPEGFETGGPVRSGLILLSFVSDGDYGGGASSGTGNFGPYSCSGNLQIATFCYSNSMQPITLGQTIPIQMQLTINSNLSGTLGGGSRELSLQAQFFEESGAPVPVSLVPLATAPEPGSVWLLAGAFLVTAGAHRRRARR